MPIGKQNEFPVHFTAEGEESVFNALKQLTGYLNQAGVAAGKTRKAGSELGRSFRNIALRTIAIIGIVRTFDAVRDSIKSAVKTGLEYNAVIEQSRLAIASLITAQGEIVSVTGRQLEGVEKLDAAYGLAVDQVKKLRIAGIQTAATTQELVDAFQQAVGAGLATGLTLDEIRQVTIRIAQAAGALGVPYRQLNEEIRSILGGIIDQNTRIAKSLQITNDQVRAAKEQNRLADFLLERFDAFDVAGQRIVSTWAALKSTIQEAFELFAGEATFPMFEQLRTRFGAQLARIFDFNTAEISKDFEQILKTLQLITGGVGDRLARAVESAVNAAVDLNSWLLENRDVVEETVAGFGHLVDGISEAVTGMGRLTALTVKLGIAAQSAETLGDALEALGRSPVLQLLLAGGVGVGAVKVLTAVAGPAAAYIGAGLLAAGAIFTAYDAVIDSQEELIEQSTRLAEAQTRDAIAADQATVRAAALAREYRQLSDDALKAGQSQQDLESAGRRMTEIEQELIDMSSDYQTAISEAGEGHQDIAAAIEEEIKSRQKLLFQQIANIAHARQEAIAQLELARAQLNADRERKRYRFMEGLVNLFGFQTEGAASVDALEGQVESLTGQYLELFKLLEQINRAFQTPPNRLQGPGGEEDPEEVLKRLRAQAQIDLALIKADLDKAQTELKIKLEQNLISYEDYYDRLDRLQQKAYAAQIAIQRRLAAAETDPGRRAAAQAQIIQLQAQANVAQQENDAARVEAAKKAADEYEQVQVRLFQATGRAAEATRAKLVAEFRDMLTQLRLEAEKNKGKIANVEHLIDVESWRAEFKALEEVIDRGQQALRDRIQQIDLQVEVGDLNQREARRATALAYQDFQDQLGKIIPRLQELSALIGNPEDEAAVERLVAQYEQLGFTIRDLNDEWKEFKDSLEKAATDALADYFIDAVEGAESFGDAINRLVGSLDGLRSLLGAIAQAIVEVTARMIAMRIVEAAIGAFGGGGEVSASGGGGGGGFAGGGAIRGPGTSTSDSILARLSDGEFVIQAKSVQKYGVGFFRALNEGSMPRPVADLRRYASGGLVSREVVRMDSARDLKGELTVGLAEGLVLQQLDSPAGDRLILKVINRNKRGIRSALG